MKDTRIIMGMPVTIEVVDRCKKKDLEDIFSYFVWVDNMFSTFKKNSEISKINRGEIDKKDFSKEMNNVLKLCEKTKKETNGFFDIKQNDKMDPSGIVKGWAILSAAKILKEKGFENYYVDAGSDIQISGKNKDCALWSLGIRHPFVKDQIVKILNVTNCGVATSGIYERGTHISNPKTKKPADEIVSLTVIGPNILEADRFSTGAFPMGKEAINFIEKTKELEGYMIDKDGIGTSTSGFDKYLAK